MGEYRVDDNVITTSGRRGVVVSVEGAWVRVRWDNDDEFIYVFHVDDRWVSRVAEEKP